MNFTIGKNRNLQDFGQIPCGTLFLNEENVPYIKISEVTDSRCNYIYNSICLTFGGGEFLPENKKVNIPNDYELKILT